MSGSTVAKALAQKRAGWIDSRIRGQSHQPAMPGAYTDMLALQQSAGNQALHELIEGSIPPVVKSVINSGGQPLEPALMVQMESRFGQDFSQVRLHTYPSASESAALLSAKAYTIGRNVVFGEGRYAPGTSDGKRLIAHELAHVVQQSRGGSAQPSIDGRGALETDAGQAAEAVVHGSGLADVGLASGLGVACDQEDYWKRAKGNLPGSLQSWVEKKETSMQAYASEKNEQATSWVKEKKTAGIELFDSGTNYVADKNNAAEASVDSNKAEAKALTAKQHIKYGGANAVLQQAAYNFGFKAAEEFADNTSPGPELIAKSSAGLVKKTAKLPWLGEKLATLDKTVQSVATDVQQGNRNFWREALLDGGIQTGLDKSMVKYDTAVNSAVKGYEDSGINLLPISDQRHGKWGRQAKSGFALAVWEMAKGLMAVGNHPVQTMRSLGNLPQTHSRADLPRNIGNAVGFLDDIIADKKNIADASEALNERQKFNPSRDWAASKGLWKGLTHNYAEDLHEGRYGRIPGRLLVDVGMFFIPGGASTKAAKGVELANEVAKTVEVSKALDVAADIGKAGEAGKGLGEVGDLAKVAPSAGEGLGEIGDLAKVAPSVGEAGKGLGEVGDLAKVVPLAGEAGKGLGEIGDLAKVAPSAGEAKGVGTLGDAPSLYKDVEGKLKEILSPDAHVAANDHLPIDLPKALESPAEVFNMPKDMPRPAEPYKFKPDYEPVSDISTIKHKPPEPPTAAPQVHQVEDLADIVQLPLKKVSGMRDPVLAGGVADAPVAMTKPRGPRGESTRPPFMAERLPEPHASPTKGPRGVSKDSVGKITPKSVKMPKTKNVKGSKVKMPRTPEDEFADFQKMLVEELGPTASLKVDKMLQLFPYKGRETIVEYLRPFVEKQGATTGYMTVGENSMKVNPRLSLNKQAKDFVASLEGAHFAPKAWGKKLPEQIQKFLPGGKYNPREALVTFTRKSTHTAMDKPMKVFFRSKRRTGAKGQEIFDAIADGIRITPDMTDSEKASRISRLSDEVFIELEVVPLEHYKKTPYMPTMKEIYRALKNKALKARNKNQRVRAGNKNKAPKSRNKKRPTKVKKK